MRYTSHGYFIHQYACTVKKHSESNRTRNLQRKYYRSPKNIAATVNHHQCCVFQKVLSEAAKKFSNDPASVFGVSVFAVSRYLISVPLLHHPASCW